MNLFLHDDVFITAIKNTLIFAVVTGPVSYILCLLIITAPTKTLS